MNSQPPIPVYDICAVAQKQIPEDEVFIEPFASYLKDRKNLRLPHRHSFYHIVLFTQGAGTHTIDFVQFSVQSSQIYFMIPGQVHSWNFEGEVDGFVINFSSGFFQPFLREPDYLEQFIFLRGNCEDSVFNLTSDVAGDCIRLFEEILKESLSLQDLKRDMIRVLLLKLFLTVGRVSGNGAIHQKHNYNYQLVKKYQKLVEQHFASLKQPGEYLEYLNTTIDHLNSICKEYLGQSSGQVVRSRVLLEAKRLLINADLSISEIAYHLNFADNSYFTKFFKKYEHTTPENFRREALIRTD